MYEFASVCSFPSVFVYVQGHFYPLIRQCLKLVWNYCKTYSIFGANQIHLLLVLLQLYGQLLGHQKDVLFSYNLDRCFHKSFYNYQPQFFCISSVRRRQTSSCEYLSSFLYVLDISFGLISLHRHNKRTQASGKKSCSISLIGLL